MIQYFKYRRILWILRKKYLEQYKELQKLEKRNQSEDDYHEANYLHSQVEGRDYWIKYLQTQYLLRKCENLIIPEPDKNDRSLYFIYDFDDECGDRHILTTAGFHHVRKLIRAEKKEKREEWLYIVSLITGVLGALIGVITVLKHK